MLAAESCFEQCGCNHVWSMLLWMMSPSPQEHNGHVSSFEPLSVSPPPFGFILASGLPALDKLQCLTTYYMENPPPLLGSIPRNEGLFIRSSSCLHCPLSTTVHNGGVDVLCGNQSALYALRTAAPMQVITITEAGLSN